MPGAANTNLGSSTVVLANSALAVLTLVNNTNSYNLTIGGLSGGGTSGGNIILGNASLGINQGANGTYAGSISGNGGVSLNANSGITLTFGGTNTYSGTTSITNGTLSANANNVFSANSAVNILNRATASLNLNNTNQSIGTLSGGGASGGNISLGSGTLTINQTVANTYAGVISGTNGSLVLSMNSNSTLTLSGTNTYSGSTSINGGALSISSVSNIGGTAVPIDFGGGTLITTANMAASNTLNFNANATLQPAANTTLTLSGTINGGNNALIMNGAGTLSVTGSSTSYSGGTFIDSGTLSTNTLGVANGAITFGGGTLINTANISTGGAVVFNANAFIQPATGTTLTITGIITGNNNALNVGGAGTVYLGSTFPTTSQLFNSGNITVAATCAPACWFKQYRHY